MPGIRHKDFRSGDRSEVFAESLLSSFALVVRVPRQEDVGVDFFCTILEEKSPKILEAGSFFSVQVKSSTKPIVYDKKHEIEWLKSQENPLFICAADKKEGTVRLFSTCNLPNAFLYGTGERVTLKMGEDGQGWSDIENKKEGERIIDQTIPLGGPILIMDNTDAADSDRPAELSRVLDDWILVDRINITNKRASMNWISVPTQWQPNVRPLDFEQNQAPLRDSFFWSGRNCAQVSLNLLRVAVLYRLELAKALPHDERRPLKEGGIREIRAIEHLIYAHSTCLAPRVKHILEEHAGMSFKD